MTFTTRLALALALPLAMFAPVPAAAGVGDLLVAPTRIVLDGRKGAEVILNNIGDEPAIAPWPQAAERMIEPHPRRLEQRRPARPGRPQGGPELRRPDHRPRGHAGRRRSPQRRGRRRRDRSRLPRRGREDRAGEVGCIGWGQAHAPVPGPGR